MASQAGSVSGWLGQLQAGDAAAAQQLWERYFQQLVALARQRLRGAPTGGADEEDVALSAFASFCRGAEHGRFPRLDDREDLWRLLVTLTARKACHLLRDERRQKRGGGEVIQEAALPGPLPSSTAEAALEQIVGREPTPAFAAEVAEELEQLLGRLATDELRSIALRKMEGHTTEEIAAQLGCARSTVERRLRLIRLLWTEEEKP